MTSVGFRVSGQYPRPARDVIDGFLGSCEAFVAGLPGPYPIDCVMGRDPADRPTLFVHVHPAAEPMFITDLGDDAPGGEDGGTARATDVARGRFVAWANTAAVGPGYHVHVCEMFHDLVARLGLILDPPGSATDQGPTGDTTTYFYTRDRAAVERAHLAALAGLCRRVIPICQADPNQDVTFSLPAGVHFTTDDPIQTLMGPRPLSWAIDVVAADDAAAQDPAVAARPADPAVTGVFPWYHPGQRARYHLGRALHRMWCDVHWNTPKFNPDRNACFEALHALDQAYAEDPTLDYPWMAWHMLLNLAKEEGRAMPPYLEEIRRQADLALRQEVPIPMVGYHVREVTYRAGDWQLRLPGDFVKRPQAVPEGIDQLAARVEATDVSVEEIAAITEALARIGGFNAFHVDLKAVNMYVLPLAAEYGVDAAGVERFLADRRHPAGKTPIGRYEHQGRVAQGIAFLFKEPDGGADSPHYMFTGLSVVPGRVAVSTIAYNDREDREVAEKIWRSIDLHQGDLAGG